MSTVGSHPLSLVLLLLEVLGLAGKDFANAGSSDTPLKICFDVDGAAGQP